MPYCGSEWAWAGAVSASYDSRLVGRYLRSPENKVEFRANLV